MTTMTCKGATVEKAVAEALQLLDVSREEVEIKIIDKGRKGFLGFGVKQAEVTVTVINVVNVSESGGEQQKDQLESAVPMKSDADTELTKSSLEDGEKLISEESIEEVNLKLDPVVETGRYLEKIALDMGIKDCVVTHEIEGKYVNFQLESSQAALLIGKRGQTLNAMQQLAQLVTNKYSEQFKVVRIDVGDYREKRRQSLELLADRMADKAVRTGQKVQLEPMPSYERKVIHHTLSNRFDVETFSEGKDPYRYLVIESVR